MSYFNWFVEHGLKHNAVIVKLQAQGAIKSAIIDYFAYDSMVVHEPTFCALYANKQKCHNMRYLNCYWCACPYFRFNDQGLYQDNGILIKSECAIKSVKSSLFIHEKSGHLDCSNCTVPHTKAFIHKQFHLNWQSAMAQCTTVAAKEDSR